MKSFLFWFFLAFLLVLRILATRQNFPDGTKLKISGQILEEPIFYNFYQKISLENFSFYLPKFPEIFYGDKIVVTGTVERGTLTDAKLITKKQEKNLLFSVRQKIINFYQKVLPEPHSSLVAGIVLGSKASIPETFWNSLRNTGVAHVVVASGMNVTLVASFILSLSLLCLSRGRAILITLIGIAIYVVLSGFDTPIIRAGIMAGLTFWAQKEGKLVNTWQILSLTALIMLIINPLWIRDIGFILSFVATASLILFEIRIRNIIFYLPEIFKEGLSTSLAAQIGVSSILFVTFGHFNLMSPIINALVLWTIPYIMIIGGIGGIIGLIVPALGRLVLYLVYPLSWFFVKTVETFS
jgi:competence protein ComEC